MKGTLASMVGKGKPKDEEEGSDAEDEPIKPAKKKAEKVAIQDESNHKGKSKK
jgi:hypothetical protein